MPLIFLRERVQLDPQRTVREVVDGQQRLRTLFAFIDPRLVEDFSESDRFTVRRTHNADLAGKAYKELDEATQGKILGYRFSVQVLPAEMEDRDILQIFARLNSTGLRLTKQELRNAAYFGEFKSRMYDLSYEQLERWLTWRIFTGEQLSRMQEVELVSDLVINMMQGLAGKTQPLIDKYYQRYDEEFTAGAEIARRFRHIMDSIDELYGGSMGEGSFRRVMHFFSLFAYLYDRSYGMKSPLVRRKPQTIPSRVQRGIAEADRRFQEGRLPRQVLEAISGAATDLGRRRTRLNFLAKICDAKTR